MADQIQSTPAPGWSKPFNNKDVKWLGDFVGATPFDKGANHMNWDNIDDDDLSTSPIDSTPDDSSSDVKFGSICGDVIGCQHYNRTENFNKERFKLESDNTYYENAVQVLDKNNQQIGHIIRAQSVPLSFILDNKLARLEGVRSRANRKYKMQIDVSLWGDVNNKDEVLSVLRTHGYHEYGHSNDPSIRPTSGCETSNSLVNRFYRSSKHLLQPKVDPHETGRLLDASDDEEDKEKEAITNERNRVRNEMDKLFDSLEEGDKTTMAEPTQAIRTPLYPHQKQALNWMICKENNEALPPFWEKRGQRYYNSLTEHTTSHRPSTVHGGILADDMGLGKTLEVISLVLTNFHDGQPLAVPVSGQNCFVQQSVTMTTVETRPQACTSNKTVLDTNKTQPYLVQDVIYIQDSDEEETEASEIFAIKPCSSSSKSKDVKKSKSLLKKKVKRSVLDDDDDDDVILSDLSRNRSSGKKMIIDSDEDSNSASYIDFKSHSAKQNDRVVIDNDKVANDNRKVKTAADIFILNSDSSSSSDDVEVNTNCKIKRKKPTRYVDVNSDDSDTEIKPPAKRVKGSCNSTTGRTKSDKPRTTLIVCPVTVMNNWESQFQQHVRDDVELNIVKFYGKDRNMDSKLLESQDVVISTYSTIAADFKNSNILGKVHWLRIVLDEGHEIRNSDTLKAIAIMELKADRRWVLTGTPIQNHIRDFYSYVIFLDISPLKDSSLWDRTIGIMEFLNDESATKCVRALMANIGLRRTKNQQVNGKPLVELPAREVDLKTIQFTDEERQVYDQMQTQGKTIIRRYFEQGSVICSYSDCQLILLQLRLFCCHPSLCPGAALKVQQVMELLGMDKQDNQRQDGGNSIIDDEMKKKLIDALLAVLNSGSDEECPICLDSLKHPVITPCAHVYCRACIESVIQQTNTATGLCPNCRNEIKADMLIGIPEKVLQEPGIPVVTDENWQSSSKIDALMKALVQQRSDDSTVKSIIVSQFTSLLNLIEVPLKLNGFKFARLDGKMSNKKRVDNVDQFMDQSPDSPTIFLLSLKAGGVGLNLTAANRVFLMEPFWNPAVEEQCFDRCHRLGQTRDVNITKFVIKDSIEDRMLALQERKRALMNGAFSKKQSADERRADSINRIKTLLDL